MELTVQLSPKIAGFQFVLPAKCQAVLMVDGVCVEEKCKF